jgi:ABC-type Fe3+-hydroxamate transport system substrate-binding protein
MNELVYEHALREADLLERLDKTRALLKSYQDEAAQLRARLEKREQAIAAFAETVAAADAHWNRPTGGQQVPFHGDFGHVPPSTQNRLRWWARRLQE